MESYVKKRQIGVLMLMGVLLTGCAEDQKELTQKPQNESKLEISKFRELEKEYDAKLGIYALNTADNEVIAYQENDRFAYASTHKALAVGALLKIKPIETLDETVNIKEEDLVNYNPITEKYVGKEMTLKALSDASIRYSDNTAANLIFEAIGGPKGFETVLREIDDDVTRPRRIEPELNDVRPGEDHDTSTAKALAKSLQAFTLGDVLPEEKQNMLNDWLIRNTTGDQLIRAGVPGTWVVGDKTGSGSYGTRNDIAVIWPPDDSPIIMAILSNREAPDADYEDELIAKAARVIVEQLTKN